MLTLLTDIYASVQTAVALLLVLCHFSLLAWFLKRTVENTGRPKHNLLLLSSLELFLYRILPFFALN